MDKEKLVELAVQTFCAVPEVYQAILKKQGYDLTDDTVEKIKSDSSFGEKLLNDEQTLAPIVQAFVENQDTIMEAMQGTLFRKGGKLDYLYSKFQKGGPLNIVLKRPNERDSVMYIKNVIGPQNAIESTIQRTYDKDGNPVTIEQETRRPITNEHWNAIVNEYNRRNQEIPSMFKPSNMNRYIVPNELQMGGPINRPFGRVEKAQEGEDLPDYGVFLNKEHILHPKNIKQTLVSIGDDFKAAGDRYLNSKYLGLLGPVIGLPLSAMDIALEKHYTRTPEEKEAERNRPKSLIQIKKLK